MPKGLEEAAAEYEQARFVENADLKRQLGAVRRTYTVEHQELLRLREDHERLEQVLDEAAILTPQPDWLKPSRKKGEPKRSTIVTVLSDVHAGERIEPDQMNDFNAYNVDIMEYRLARYFEKVVSLARDGYLGPQKRDGIVLAMAGDMVSGDIHDELSQTNDLSVFEAVLWLAPRIVAGLEMWAEYFGNVHMVNAPGNHPRNSRIPRYKGRSVNNADYLLAKIVAGYWGAANRTNPVTFDIPKSIDAFFNVYGLRFSMEHGDELQKNNPGTSEIGSLGPAKRGTLRKMKQARKEGSPFDYLILGHFHQYVPAADQGFIMNGSLKGYDEYARGKHLDPEPPQQAALVVTPEYGCTNAVPIKVSKRSEEGW